MTKPASRDRPSERGDGASPLPTPRSSHFGAACGERDGSSPLADDMRCPHGTDQGGTVEVLPPLTCVRGGFSALEKRGYTGVLSASPISAPVPPGWHPDFFRFRGEIPFVSGDPQPERAFAHSCSGKDPVPPLTAPELGTALLALWDRWEGTPCWEELPPELTAVPFWKGTARSYRAFFRAHRLIVAAFGHPNPGDISLAYWPRHLENNIWGVVKGQVELQVRLDRELPDLPRKIGMAARAAAGRGGADGSHHAGDWK